ncbi:MAG: hypothetical protein KF812_07220 [Fimbriimonadaceae bacterium]|nr:hypothetical protein [Fimbriimonadaceae bacterium]
MKSQVETKHIIIIVGILVAMGIGFGYFAMFRQNSSGGGQEEIDSIRLRILSSGTAMRLYTIDNESRFPRSEAWMDSVAPYSMLSREGETVISPEQVFQDPRNSESEHGIAMNSSVSGMHGDRLVNFDKFVLLFTSTNKQRNAAGGQEIFRCDFRPEGSEFDYGYGVTIQPMPIPVNCQVTNGFTFAPAFQ